MWLNREKEFHADLGASKSLSVLYLLHWNLLRSVKSVNCKNGGPWASSASMPHVFEGFGKLLSFALLNGNPAWQKKKKSAVRVIPFRNTN